VCKVADQQGMAETTRLHRAAAEVHSNHRVPRLQIRRRLNPSRRRRPWSVRPSMVGDARTPRDTHTHAREEAPRRRHQPRKSATSPSDDEVELGGGRRNPSGGWVGRLP
jgi:hypothetical protein